MNTQNPIQSTHWQLAPDTDTKSVVEGIDDIHLCIANILNTLKGTDILRPEFGSDHFQYIDYPYDEAVPNFVREITQALQRWKNALMFKTFLLMAKLHIFFLRCVGSSLMMFIGNFIKRRCKRNE